MRVKGLQLVNQAWYVNAIVMMIKPFLSQKLKNRVRLMTCDNSLLVHSQIILHGRDYDSLHEVFNPDVLPVCMGGNQCALSTLSELLREYRNNDMDAPHVVPRTYTTTAI